MYVVRYRTHGPWQSEPRDTSEAAMELANELSKGYKHVVVDYHEQLLEFKDGQLSGPNRLLGFH